MPPCSAEEQLQLVRDGIAGLGARLDAFEAARSSGAEMGARLGGAVLRRLLAEAEAGAEEAADAQWVLLSSVVVVLMTTPGVMLYYAGSVRVENVLATAMQGFSLACLITLLWTAIGYSLAFAPASENEDCTSYFALCSFVGDGSRAWLSHIQHSDSHQVADIPEYAFCFFQLSFAIITPVLISGAMVDRMKFTSLLTSMGLWHLLVYCPIAHVFWHPHGLMWRLGVLDFAGGNVVHLSAGSSALVGALIIGKREGFGKRSFHPHNMLVSITGACFLWIGWYGFNSGSALAADSAAGISFLNTQIASSAAALAWMCVESLLSGQPSIVGLMNGSIAGLVAITPCSGYVDPSGSFVVGISGGLACFYGVKIKEVFEFDDALDCFGIHAIGGIVGNLLVGCLAKESVGDVNGAFYGNGHQFVKQIYGTLFTIAFSSVMTAVILFIVDKLIGLRLSTQEERSGMDRAVHNTSMYSQLATVRSKPMSTPSNIAGHRRPPTPSAREMAEEMMNEF